MSSSQQRDVDGASSVQIPLRAPFQYAGLRYVVVEVRPPSTMERHVMMMSFSAALEMHRAPADFMCRIIANFGGIPEAAVDEMACDDADRVFQQIARMFCAVKERINAAS